MKGLTTRYLITNRDGTALPQGAVPFVLRLDTDPIARQALLKYAHLTPNEELARDLYHLLSDLLVNKPLKQTGEVDTEKQGVVGIPAGLQKLVLGDSGTLK